MSEPLRDLRAKITPEVDAVLEAKHRASGQDRSEIVRNVLHQWAMSEIHEASVLHERLIAEGLPGIVGGMRGNRGESQGR